MSLTKDFAALLEAVAVLEAKYQENTPKASHVRVYAETLRESIESAMRNIASDKLLWSDLHVPSELMHGYRIGNTGLSISAYSIKYKQEALKHPGYWCYCNSDARYYIAINDVVHGGTFLNIMRNENVYKFNEHSHAKTVDYKSTGLYVPPEINPTSKDVRNLPQTLDYVPSTEKTAKKHVVRIGDVRNLSADIDNLNDQEYRLISDITINNLLDLTVAAKERVSLIQ